MRTSACDSATKEQGEGGADEEARRDFEFVGSCKGQGSALQCVAHILKSQCPNTFTV